MNKEKVFEMFTWFVIIGFLALSAYIIPDKDAQSNTISFRDATPQQIDQYLKREMREQIAERKMENDIFFLETKRGKSFANNKEANDAVAIFVKQRKKLIELHRKESDGNWVAFNRQIMFIGKGSSIDHPVYQIHCAGRGMGSFVEMIDVKQSNPNKVISKDGKISIGFLWDNDTSDGDWVAVNGHLISNDTQFKAHISSVNKFLRPTAQGLMRGDDMTITTTKDGYRLDDIVTIKTPSRRVVNKFLADCGEMEVAHPGLWRKRSNPPKPIQRLHGDTELHHLVRNGQLGKVRKLVSTSSIHTICATNNIGQTPWELAYILGKWETAMVLATADGNLC